MADKHKGEELKGRIKEGVGDVTGDKGLEREGKVDQGSAKTKNTIEDVSRKIKETVNPKK